MYEQYTRQALPTSEYRELLGSAICVYNSNNAFIIENILKHDEREEYSWGSLINETSGKLSQPIKKTITKSSGTEIAAQFEKVVIMRNRIIHSFQITNENGEQILATRKKNGEQFRITQEFLYDFITENQNLSSLLHSFRGY